MKKIISLVRHVAFIMDGNGRWAEQRGLPRLEGHSAGVANIRPIIEHLDKHGVEYVMLYAFSTENWGRPANEVNGIFHILEEAINKESHELHRRGAKIIHVGSTEGMPVPLRESIGRAVALTAGNTGIKIGVAFNYGGRLEIVEAVRRIIAGRLAPDEIDEKTFGEYLYTSGFPDVDMVIRTGGEFRTSNFLLWQTAYSEYYFTPVLWPDFNKTELEKALYTFSQRQRRFGRLQARAACSGKGS